jgi:predicted amidohydrolase
MSRKVRIATVAQRLRGAGTPEENRRLVLGLARQAAAQRPDLICLPETFLILGVDFEKLEAVAETVPGPTTDTFAALARKHNCYIICPLIVDRGDVYTNECVLIDRGGEIVGAYSKIHPVVYGSEFTNLERGITPGSEAPVFETDFGRIGMQICFDLMYDDGWQALKQQGAEIVFWSSAYDGGKHLSIRAWNQRYYVVSAVNSNYARIIDMLGEVRGVTGPRDPVLARTIDLDIGLFHMDFNNVVLPRLVTHFGPDITLRILHEEGVFTLESNVDDVSVADITQEFDLDPYDDYLERNARLQDAWRQGLPVPDLTPSFVGREQWV